eukprot:m.115241 g.115241  ORF g.115241 m.115241 type:complete len:794 (-) comp13556_c0_seq3:1072-3453(-)
MASDEEGRATAEVEATPERRKRRGLLQMYYGSMEKKDEKASNPLDIDGSSFDAADYMKTMRVTKSLPDLIHQEETVVREVKSLDSDMQTLVYDNYNKFISATDTIRAMKTQVSSMEQQMEKLTASMTATFELSETISATLAPRREKVMSLANSHTTLKRLQFLFELPARLQQCIEMGAVGQAVQYYSKAQRVLESYRHMESFNGIYDDCKSIMDKLQAQLEAKLDHDGVTIDIVRNTMPLLLELKHTGIDMCHKVISSGKAQWDTDRKQQQKRFQTAAVAFNDSTTQEQDAEEQSATQPETSDGPSLASNLDARVEQLEAFVMDGNQHCFYNLVEWILCYQDAFLGTDDQAQAGLPKDEADQASELLVEFTSACLHEYFEDLSATFEKCQFVAMPPPKTVELLALAANGIATMQEIVPSVNVTDQCAQFATKMLMQAASAYVKQMHQQLDVLFKVEFDGTFVSGTDLQQAATVTTNAIKQALVTAIQNVSALVKINLTARSETIESTLIRRVVLKQVIGAIGDDIAHQLLKACSSPSSTPATCCWAAMLSLALPQELGGIVDAAQVNLDVPPRAITKQVAMCEQQLQSLARSLRSILAMQLGTMLSQLVADSYTQTNWFTHGPCVGPSPIVEDVCTLLHQGLEMVSAVFPIADGCESLTTLKSFRSRIQQDTVSQVHRLFSDAIEIFQVPEPCADSILATALRVLLKSIHETVRTLVFNAEGAAQLQVDMFQLHSRLANFVFTPDVESDVNALFGQVVSSVLLRCTQDVKVVDPSEYTAKVTVGGDMGDASSA